MGDEKSTYDALPIPTYEEATSSRPPSSLSRIGPEEVSDDAERQGLLSHDSHDHGQSSQYPSGYQPPTVESARSSLDFLPSSGNSSVRGSTEDLRRELEQMDVEEPIEGASSSRSLFSKRFTGFRRTLSAIHLPIRKYLPSFNFRWNFLSSAIQEADHQKCIIILRVVGLLIVVGIVYAVFISDVFNLGRRLNMGQIYEAESVRIYVQSHINETNIVENLEKLTSHAHLAGTEGNFVLAEWVDSKFRSDLMDEVVMEEYDVYLNYPKTDGRRVAIVDPPNLVWEAKLEEEQVYNAPPREQTLVFHGHSKSGDVTGPLIYANHGSRADFKALADMGVKLDGAIALVRSGAEDGMAIKAAELAGTAGCIVYSDPAGDGFVKGKTWPEGRYLPKDGVQRGSVSLTPWVVGDILSPDFASLPKEKRRLSPEESSALPKIPSVPISWRDAQHLLKALQNHGNKVPSGWEGGVQIEGDWWTGDSSSPKVNLVNSQDEVERQPIYNVLGRISGIEQPDKKIVIGSHRDSWCFGAAGAASGTAVLLEVARIFGELRSLGWRPLRTIEFASWDGSEYNLVGSTEHVEQRLDDLRFNGFAYLNVDVAVSGNRFRAAASPIFEQILTRILKRTADPASNEALESIWARQQSKLEGLGVDSDYVAFQDLAGISSIDIGFTGDPYPSHSCYNTFEWMSKYGDPGFQYHRVLGEIWALLLLEMADNPLLPYDVNAYARALAGYVTDLEGYAKSKNVPLKSQAPRDDHGSSQQFVDIQPLHKASEALTDNAQRFHKWGNSWNYTVAASGGFESNIMAIRRINHNSFMAEFEAHLLDLEDGGGLPNRTQYKHVIFGPQAWSSNNEAYFPAIRDAIDSGDWTQTQYWIDRIANIITIAAERLN